MNGFSKGQRRGVMILLLLIVTLAVIVHFL